MHARNTGKIGRSRGRGANAAHLVSADEPLMPPTVIVTQPPSDTDEDWGSVSESAATTDDWDAVATIAGSSDDWGTIV